jgi:hypothetical protein
MSKRVALRRWTGRLSWVFLVLCSVALVAFVVGIVLLGSAWKAPRGCEECDPYFGRMMLVYALLAISVVSGIIGIAFHAASTRGVTHHVPRRRRMGRT